MNNHLIRKLNVLPREVSDFTAQVFRVCNDSVSRQLSIFPNTHEEALDQLLISEFAKMQGPLKLSSDWVIRIDAHYIGGGRHFRNSEIADLGLMLMFRRNGKLLRSKLVFLQSKKLFGSTVKHRDYDPFYRQGMGRLLLTEEEHNDLVKRRNIRLTTKSRYRALKAKDIQTQNMRDFAARYGIDLFYLFYNPYVIPWSIPTPVTTLPEPVQNVVGCRIVPTKNVSDSLARKNAGYNPSYADLEEAFSGENLDVEATAGWRLEDFASKLFLACKVGFVDDSHNFEAMVGMFQQKQFPIAAAVSMTFDVPSNVDLLEG